MKTYRRVSNKKSNYVVQKRVFLFFWVDDVDSKEKYYKNINDAYLSIKEIRESKIK